MGDCISREEAKNALREQRHRLTVADEASGYGNVKWSEYVIYAETAENAIDALPAADVRPVRWIPVEERMPETDKLVLVVRSDGDMAVAGWNAALGWLHYWSGFRVRNVTHWMPLPEPPNCGARMEDKQK